VPGVITRSYEVALFFSEDLLHLVNTANIDLARGFQVPPEYSQDIQDIINMLYEDIAHILRDGLIHGIHLVISDNDIDKGTNAYKVRYHVHYRVDMNSLGSATPIADTGERQGLEFGPPLKVWHNARFALLVDWHPSARKNRHQVCRPDYCFDWVTEENRFDATNLICFREGQLVGDSAQIVSREELAPLEHHQDII
jgi:hypothetical protein